MTENDQMKIAEARSSFTGKTLMKEAFANAEGRELYEASKELEKDFHEPVLAAEQVERQATKSKSRSQAPTRHM
jgi:hypothetical protein